MRYTPDPELPRPTPGYPACSSGGGGLQPHHAGVTGTGLGTPLTTVMGLEKKLPFTGAWLAVGQNAGGKGEGCLASFPF